jgi:light-regulated signal transduction histidine kinase (bacteriophytochrome)
MTDQSLPGQTLDDPDMTEVDVGKVVNEAIRNLQSLVARAAARITVSPMPRTWGCHSQLVDVFQTLIGNALLDARPGHPPHVNVLAFRDRERWAFLVRDHGRGLEPAELERICDFFLPYRTLACASDLDQGLARCKQVVARHHGRIRVESALGKGSSFYLTLARCHNERIQDLVPLHRGSNRRESFVS